VAPGSPEEAPVGLLVESDQERPADPQRGGPQVTAGADEQAPEDGFVRLVALQIHPDHPLAPCGHDLIRLARQPQRFLGADGALLGVDGLQRLDLPLRKKLLRFSAALSAGPMVPPAHLGHLPAPMIASPILSKTIGVESFSDLRRI
jgi:hypothetical protein